MEEKRYLISDAAKAAEVEPHVLRYWEEELSLPIQRTELGHRYYTEEDIQTFQNIKELKDRGFQLKAIKVLIPELKKHSAASNDSMINLEQKLNDSSFTSRPAEERTGTVSEHSQTEKAGTISETAQAEKALDTDKEDSPEDDSEPMVTLLPMTPNLDKLSQFEGIMTNLFRQTLKDNNDELENRISDTVLKGMDMLMQIREEKEEERFRRLDETIRVHQKKGKMVAAAKEPGRFHFFSRRRAGT